MQVIIKCLFLVAHYNMHCACTVYFYKNADSVLHKIIQYKRWQNQHNHDHESDRVNYMHEKSYASSGAAACRSSAVSVSI